MPRGKEVSGLPYMTRIYINGQVLLPAMLVRALGIEWARYADIVIRHNGRLIRLRGGVQLLRARRAASRQFTIPSEVRAKFGGVMPLDRVEIIDVRPLRASDVKGGPVIVHESDEH